MEVGYMYVDYARPAAMLLCNKGFSVQRGELKVWSICVTEFTQFECELLNVSY